MDEKMKKPAMDRDRERRRKMEEDLRKAGEGSTMQLGPGHLSKEEKDILQQMMKDDEMRMKPKGYKKGGMVTRGQGCVTRKKSCKMC
jgi:hypothetical protein